MTYMKQLVRKQFSTVYLISFWLCKLKFLKRFLLSIPEENHKCCCSASVYFKDGGILGNLMSPFQFVDRLSCTKTIVDYRKVKLLFYVVFVYFQLYCSIPVTEATFSMKFLRNTIFFHIRCMLFQCT